MTVFARRLPGSPTLTTVVSEPFRVVGRAEFPGTVEIATEWTRHMHRQGLNICECRKITALEMSYNQLADIDIRLRNGRPTGVRHIVFGTGVLHHALVAPLGKAPVAAISMA